MMKKAVNLAERITVLLLALSLLSFWVRYGIIITHMARKASPPTKIQKEVLDFIKEFTGENGYAPTLREIGGELNGRSTATIHQHVKALEAKGYLSKKENSPRSLVVETEEQIIIPLLGTIAAGSPIGVFEDPTPIPIPKSMVPHREGYYALRVSGDSMVEDGIWDDDIIIIRQQNDASLGDIIVAIIQDDFGDESATLKAYYPRENKEDKIELRPRNPNLKSLFVDPKNFQIRGKFVGLIRSE